jgi:hypothetical protein
MTIQSTCLNLSGRGKDSFLDDIAFVKGSEDPHGRTFEVIIDFV